MWTKIWMELKMNGSTLEESNVWKPNVDSGPSWWEKMEGTPGCPGDGLDPCHWVPCLAGGGGECKDLAVCRVCIIL